MPSHDISQRVVFCRFGKGRKTNCGVESVNHRGNFFRRINRDASVDMLQIILKFLAVSYFNERSTQGHRSVRYDACSVIQVVVKQGKADHRGSILAIGNIDLRMIASLSLSLDT